LKCSEKSFNNVNKYG